MKQRISALVLAGATLLLFTGCALSGSLPDGISGAWNTVKTKASSLFSSTKDAATKAYGTAKNKAVYVYDAASDWASDAYASASDKAAELIGDGKEFLEGLTDIDDISVSDVEDYAPYATAKSELFVPYYISSLLAERGYTVYNGGVYYKGHVYGGLIFTKDAVFLEEDGETIYSCGFLQLVSDTYTDVRITERMVETGLIAVSAAADGEQAKTFVVQEYARLPDFGGVKDNVYFTFRQTGNYVAEIRFQDNDASAYDSTIENYDFDAGKVISPAPAGSEIEKLYAESPERFAAAADAANSVADYVEHTGTELSSLLVLDNNVLDGLCEKITKGYSAVAGYATGLLEKVSIGDSPLVRLDAAGQAHLFDSDAPADAERMANGLVCALGTGMMTAMKVTGTVATVAFCVQNGVLVVPVIVITTGACSIVYNISNMLEGMQDVYYGAKGDVTEAENPVLALFKKVIGDDRIATLVYHIWGISTTMVAGVMKPVAQALNFARITGMNVFRTVGAVARAALVQLAKTTATGVASGLVCKYVKKVVAKVTGSNALGTLVGFGSASISSYLVYTGLNQFDMQFNLSGAYPKLGFIVEKDELGRQARAKLFLKQSKEPRKAMPSIHEVGQGSELPGDERGHIIGHQLGGEETLDNLIPMDAKLNRGAYRQWETELLAALKAGKTVYVEVELHYEGTSHRPTELIGKYVIDGVKGVRIFQNGV